MRIGGTRFVCHKGVLLATVRQYCGSVDSFEHLMACGRIGEIPRRDASEEGIATKVQFLVKLTDRAYNVNAGYPVPCNMEDIGEVELYPQSDSEESEEALELVFEKDEDGVGGPAGKQPLALLGRESAANSTGGID